MKNNFDEMITKVLEAIDSIETTSKLEAHELASLEYIIAKFCENEEIFKENLKILDKHSNNGSEAHYQKKFGRR